MTILEVDPPGDAPRIGRWLPGTGIRTTLASPNAYGTCRIRVRCRHWPVRALARRLCIAVSRVDLLTWIIAQTHAPSRDSAHGPMAAAKYRMTIKHLLTVSPSDWIAENAFAFAIRDPQPVSVGHTLVVLRRSAATWFEASAEEQSALFGLVEVVKAALDALVPRPDGYNVGFDAGEAAGQLYSQLHLHVIPRFVTGILCR